MYIKKQYIYIYIIKIIIQITFIFQIIKNKNIITSSLSKQIKILIYLFQNYTIFFFKTTLLFYQNSTCPANCMNRKCIISQFNSTPLIKTAVTIQTLIIGEEFKDVTT